MHYKYSATNFENWNSKLRFGRLIFENMDFPFLRSPEEGPIDLYALIPAVLIVKYKYKG